MDILKEVVEVTYTEIASVCLLCVTLGIIVAMVIEEFKKQDMKMNGGLQAHWQDEWILQIQYVQKRDAGRYECQLNTQPVRSFFVQLSVVGK